MNLKMPVLQQQHIPKGWFSKHSTGDLENWIYYYIICHRTLKISGFVKHPHYFQIFSLRNQTKRKIPTLTMSLMLHPKHQLLNLYQVITASYLSTMPQGTPLQNKLNSVFGIFILLFILLYYFYLILSYCFYLILWCFFFICRVKFLQMI